MNIGCNGWTLRNTDGFTDAELSLINEVREEILSANKDLLAETVDHALNNRWHPYITKEELKQAMIEAFNL